MITQGEEASDSGLSGEEDGDCSEPMEKENGHVSTAGVLPFFVL